MSLGAMAMAVILITGGPPPGYGGESVRRLLIEKERTAVIVPKGLKIARAESVSVFKATKVPKATRVSEHPSGRYAQTNVRPQGHWSLYGVS